MWGSNLCSQSDKNSTITTTIEFYSRQIFSPGNSRLVNYGHKLATDIPIRGYLNMFKRTNTQFREYSLLCKGKYHCTADLQENGSFSIWQFFSFFWANFNACKWPKIAKQNAAICSLTLLMFLPPWDFFQLTSDHAENCQDYWQQNSSLKHR